MNWKKAALVTGATVVVGGGVVAGLYLRRLSKAGDTIEVTPSIKVHRLDGEGLTLRVDTLLKNPSSKDFRIKFPYIRLVYENSVVGSSQIENRDIGIPKNSETKITGMMVKIPLTKIFSTAAKLAKAILAGEDVKLLVVSMTYVDPFWKYDEEKKEWLRLFHPPGMENGIKYASSEPITIQKAQLPA
jgi:hypothetical protein